METTDTKNSADTAIKEEKVVNTGNTREEAREANAKAREAGREAMKKDAEVVASAVKGTVAKTTERTKKAATSTRKAVRSRSDAPKTKRKYTRKPRKNIIVQYLGSEISEDVLTERALAQFASMEGAVTVKTITLYIKPEDHAAYYVINDEHTGRVDF